MKRKLLALGLCICLLTSCSLPLSPEEPKNGGVLNLFGEGETNPLNPSSKADKAFFDLLYDSLFVLSESFEPQPVLAERYEIMENQVKIYLKSGICFSDGTVLDADDVVSTCNTLRQHSEYVYASALSDVTDISAETDHTVVITTERANDLFVAGLTFPILPAATQSGLYAAGSGPYRFASATQNERVFEVNEHYHATAPYITTVRLHLLPDADTVRYAYRSGTIDVMYTQARKISDYSGVSSTVTPFESLKLSYVGYRADHPLLQNKQIRQAISLAVQRQKLVDNVLMGYGTVTDTPFQPNHYLFKDWYEEPNVDVDAALLKIAQAFSDAEEPPSFTFSLLVNGDDATAVNLGASITEMLGACGLDVTVEELPYDTYRQRVVAGEFDAYLGQIDFLCAEDVSALMTTGGSLNYGGYENEQINVLFSDLKVAENENVGTIAEQLSALLREEQPVLSLYFEQDLLMSKNSISGEKQPKPERPFFGICGWYRM